MTEELPIVTSSADDGDVCCVASLPVVVLKLRIAGTDDPLEPAVLMSMDGDGTPVAITTALRAMADRVEELFGPPARGRMMN